MTDKPIDIDLPDSFHRLKRTALVLSSGLLLLTVATPSEQHRVNLAFVDLELKTWTVLVGLWFAAAYYVWGFLMEVRVAERLNSETMRSEGAKRYDERVSGLAEESAAILSRIDSARATVFNAASRFMYQKDSAERDLKTRSALEDIVIPFLNGEPVPTHPSKSTLIRLPGYEGVQKVYEARLEGLLTRINDINRSNGPDIEYVKSFRASIENAHSDLEQLKVSTSLLADKLVVAHRDISRMSPRLARERTVSFWIWEVGGVLSAFGVATVFVGWTLIALFISATLAPSETDALLILIGRG